LAIGLAFGIAVHIAIRWMVRWGAGVPEQVWASDLCNPHSQSIFCEDPNVPSFNSRHISIRRVVLHANVDVLVAVQGSQGRKVETVKVMAELVLQLA
jgi:hypothetical protein